MYQVNSAIDHLMEVIPLSPTCIQSSEISTIKVSFLQRQSQEVHFSYTLAKSEPEKQQAVVSG